MPHKCAVVGCGAAPNRNHPNLSFHRLPTNEARKRMWLDIIGTKNLITHTKNIFICSLHFEESSINRTLGVVRLRDDAVPSRSTTKQQLSTLAQQECPTLTPIEPNEPSSSQQNPILEPGLKEKQALQEKIAGQRRKIKCLNEKVRRQNIRIEKSKATIKELKEKFKLDMQAPLHLFPHPVKDLQRLKTWVNCIRGDIIGMEANDIHKHRRICHVHFEEKFTYHSCRLSNNAVPTLYLPDPLSLPKFTYIERRQQRKEQYTPQCSLLASEDPFCVFAELPKIASQPTVTINVVETIEGSCTGRGHRLTGSASHALSRRIPEVEGSSTTGRNVRQIRGTLQKTSEESTSAPSPPTELGDCDIDDPPEVDNSEDIRHSHSDKPTGIELLRECAKESDVAETVSKEPETIKTYRSKADKTRPVKQVLQLRLIDDEGVCDEPIYEVLTDDEADKDVDKKQIATQTDVQNTSSSVNDPPSKESEVQSAPIDTPAERTTPTCDKYMNKEYWKLKLKHILHNTQFCGVCLEADVDINALSDVFEITDDERTWSTSLADIVHKVFREGEYWPANSQICNNCTKKLIQSYIFIRNAEETSRMLERHLDELYTKTCYVRNNSLKDANSTQPRIYNVVIALDNKVISQDFESNEIKIETPEPVQSERGQIGDKRKLRCVSCNVVVRSYRAWRRHERTAHKQSVRCRICLQSYKTQRALTTHYRTHLRSRCPFCHRTVRDGGLLQHLKTRHKHSIHSCTTCNVALYSAEALGTHIEECHRREGSKCVTCLQSLSRVELERHQCRFKCPECEELPCVHHRHLMWYREQMGLDPGPRAKCADCRYVASSKQALLAHVNATHLSQQSLRYARCGQHFYRRAHLDKHVCASGRGNKHLHECRYCGKAFSNLYMWKRHEKHCKDIQRRYQCDDCPANFDSTKDHMIHRKLKHGKDFLSCRLCDRVFLNDLKRTRHERQAHGEQRGRASLVCAACHTEFSSKAALELHMRYHGAEVMDQLDSLGQLKSHKHRRRRSFAVCEVCGAVMRRILLKKHMKGHSMATVSCKTCGKSFQSPTLLRDHQSVHARTASCPRCNKVISSAKLWRHFRNHLIRDSLNVKVAAIHAL